MRLESGRRLGLRDIKRAVPAALLAATLHASPAHTAGADKSKVAAEVCHQTTISLLQNNKYDAAVVTSDTSYIIVGGERMARYISSNPISKQGHEGSLLTVYVANKEKFYAAWSGAMHLNDEDGTVFSEEKYGGVSIPNLPPGQLNDIFLGNKNCTLAMVPISIFDKPKGIKNYKEIAPGESTNETLSKIK